jgi:hypothetical protein
LPIDQFCRRLHDQLRAAAALDDDKQCAAVLRTLVNYLEAGEVELRQTAFLGGSPDPSAPFVGKVIHSKFPNTCAVCGGGITLGEPILYNGARRKGAHERCGKAAG